MDVPRHHDVNVVDRAARGDVQALAALLASSRARLYSRLASRIPADLRGFVDAEDIIQESHIAVFRHIRKFEARDDESFHRWVAVIAIRKLREAIASQRAVKRRRKGPGPLVSRATESRYIALVEAVRGLDPSASWTATQSEMIEAVRRALTQLTEDQQQAVSFVYLRGCSLAETAAIMGRTEAAINGLCYLARRRLRSLLQAGRSA
ncbi:MAG: RNA polymerase sigma factor [Phycisphaerae bacterium]